MVTRRMVSNSSNQSSAPIRRRFAAWSLAVFGALSSSGMVCLQPSAAWGFDDSTAEKKDEKEEKDKSDEVFNREVFSNLLRTGKVDEAIAKLDTALANAPDDVQLLSMEVQAASFLAMQSKPEEGRKRLAALTTKLLAKPELDMPSASVLMQVAMLRPQAERDMPFEEKMAFLDEVEAKLKKDLGERAVAMIRSLSQTKVRLMVAADKSEQAKSMLDSMVAEARADVDPEKPMTLSAYSSAVTLYCSSLRTSFPDAVKTISNEAEELFAARLAADDSTVDIYSSYLRMKLSMTSALTYSDPKQGLANLADIDKVFADAKERFEPSELQPLVALERSVQSMKKQMETAMEREELIGTQAPPIQTEHFVGMKPVTMEELQGKVVLLDFWAVWCGPCIATFPHLIEWHEKFSDKGLVILGATNFYNYKWDEEAGKAARPEEGVEVSPEDELAMLEKFRESHKLHHGFFVNPKGSKYSASFAVTGIPQAVLLDKQGKIQLIRVGSGDANAKAIEAKIEELLAQ